MGEPESLWKDTYKSDCSKVGDWADVVDGMFKGGNNSEEKSFNKCARVEAEKVVKEKMEECLTPLYCAYQGKEAAAIVMAIYTAPYCVVKKSKAKVQEEPSIEKMCKDYAIASCKTYLPEAYEKIKKISKCSEDIDDIFNWD